MKKLLKKVHKKNNSGTTLVEIIVSFALMGIFMAAAATIIGMITSLFWDVKGETYARQVGDIVAEKIASEICGSEFDESILKFYNILA